MRTTLMRASTPLLFLLLLPMATSQSASIPDPTGDTQASGSAIPASWIDLTNVAATPQDEGLAVAFTFADRTNDAPDGITGGETWLQFTYRDDTFRAGINLGTDQLPSPENPSQPLRLPSAYLFIANEGAWIAKGTFAANQNGNTADAVIPWSAMEESHEFSPSPGEAVTVTGAGSEWDTDVTPYHNPSGLPTVTILDDVTTEGIRLVVPGLSATGILATTPAAIKFSNGEATTFHWPIEITNRAANDQDFTLDWKTPNGFEATYPPGLSLKAGATATIDLYASASFSHNHGTTIELPLAIHGGTEEAEVKLGVLYPAVPQPAGHHPTLYLHGPVQQGTTSARGAAWMNTVDEDPDATAMNLVPDSAQCLAGELPSSGLRWTFPLQPRLLLGLDARQEPALLEATLHAEAPLAAGVVAARIDITHGAKPPGDLDLADPLIAKQDVAANPSPGNLAVNLEIPLPPEMDYMAPTVDTNLRLLVYYCGETLDFDPAPLVYDVLNNVGSRIDRPIYTLQAGGSLRMPLEEYHDKIDIRSNQTFVSLEVKNPVKRIQPGGVAAWEIHARRIDGAADYNVRVIGPNRNDATLHSPNQLRLTQDGTNLPVSLRVPEGSSDLIIPEIVVLLTKEGDASQSAAIRLQAIPDPAGQDDADQLAKFGSTSADTPGLQWLATLATLALGFAILRRKYT